MSRRGFIAPVQRGSTMRSIHFARPSCRSSSPPPSRRRKPHLLLQPPLWPASQVNRQPLKRARIKPMPKACTVRRARNSGRNAKRGVAHRSDGSRRYSTFGSPRPLSIDLAAHRRPRGDRIKTLQPVCAACCSARVRLWHEAAFAAAQINQSQRDQSGHRPAIHCRCPASFTTRAPWHR